MDLDHCIVFKAEQHTGHIMAKAADIETKVISDREKEKFGEACKDFRGTKEVVVYLDCKQSRGVGFADRGDSGSWVFHPDGTWFGMVIGCTWRLDRNAVDVTPAEMLKTHIEQVTECDLSLL